MRLKIWK